MERVPSVFFCPICCQIFDDDFHFPLIACSNGHTLCASCDAGIKQSTSKCPMCREKVNDGVVRNLVMLDALEKVLETLNEDISIDPRSIEVDKDRAFIGSGATSDVYVGSYSSSYVAIKRARSKDASIKRKISRELRLLQNMRHPNIVSVYGQFEWEGMSSIVMEYGDGGSLEDLFGKKIVFSFHECIDFALAISSGLEYLHSHRVIHRDLKPGNILICHGIPKISDFGGSKILQDTMESSLGSGQGTLRYAAP
jgi:tRNA A-37 threonylcarbamoyl transferase component Bud32